MTPELDIVIPVYNEGRNIVATLGALGARRGDAGAGADLLRSRRGRYAAGDPRQSAGPCRAARRVRAQCRPRRPRRGHDRLRRQHRAVRADVSRRRRYQRADGSTAWSRWRATDCDIVCASRFIPGGAMVGCPLLKAVLVRTRELHAAARSRGCPTTDASNGFRLFSRRVIERIAVESDQGFCYSIELLVKAHRLGWTDRVKCRCDGSSAATAKAGSACSSGCRPICAGTATPSPPPCCGGRRDTVALKGARHDGRDRSHEMAEDTLAPHHHGLAVDEHHRARGGVRAAVQPPQIYHAVEQADYISIVALTRDGKIPIVRQYRPAIEAFAWELPAGLVDPGEDPAEGCRRELLEETGLTARTIHRLGENVRLHRPPQQPHPLVLRRGRRALAVVRAGAGRHREAGVAGGARPADQGRRFRLAASPRRLAARRAARLSGAAATPRRPARKRASDAQTRRAVATDALYPMTAHPTGRTCGRARARAQRWPDASRCARRNRETGAAARRGPRRAPRPRPPAGQQPGHIGVAAGRRIEQRDAMLRQRRRCGQPQPSVSPFQSATRTQHDDRRGVERRHRDEFGRSGEPAADLADRPHDMLAGEIEMRELGERREPGRRWHQQERRDGRRSR